MWVSAKISRGASTHRGVVRTVDLLDEGLDLALLVLLLLRHAAGDLGGVALDAGDEGVREGMRLGAVVEGGNDHALLAGIAAPGDDLEICEFVRACDSSGLRHTTTRPTLRLWKDTLAICSETLCGPMRVQSASARMRTSRWRSRAVLTTSSLLSCG